MKFNWLAFLGVMVCLVPLSPLYAGGWVVRHCHRHGTHALRLQADAKGMNTLCRVPHQSAMLPGLTEGHSCHVLVGNDVKPFKHYQVYCVHADEQPVQWVTRGFGGYPENAWAVGWLLHDVPVYMCRVLYEKQWYFGVVHSGPNGVCDTFARRNTRDFSHYEVLVMRHQRFAHVWF